MVVLKMLLIYPPVGQLGLTPHSGSQERWTCQSGPVDVDTDMLIPADAAFQTQKAEVAACTRAHTYVYAPRVLIHTDTRRRTFAAPGAFFFFFFYLFLSQM